MDDFIGAIGNQLADHVYWAVNQIRECGPFEHVTAGRNGQPVRLNCFAT